MKLEPRNHGIVLQRMSRDSMTKSGIALLVDEDKKLNIGKVLGKCPTVQSCEIGDVVMFTKYAAIEEFVVDGNAYLYMREADVMAIVTDLAESEVEVK